MTRTTKLHRITVTAITKAVAPCVLDDGGGLQLAITSATARKWTMRYTHNGRRRMMGLGKYPTVTLDAAREAAATIRKQVSEQRDPILERKIEEGKNKTFKEAFEEFFEDKKKTFSNGKHIYQWTRNMEMYVYPFVGNDSIATITPKQVVDVLRPIWHTMPETASRIHQRMNAVFEKSIVLEERYASNPCSRVSSVLGQIQKNVEHHRALHYSKAPAFITSLRQSTRKPITKLAFEFLILTAARSSQVREAPAHEVNPDTGLWTIPAERMKSRRQHIVPLPPRALEIYQEARRLTGETDLLFPSDDGKPLSDMTFNKVLRDFNMDGDAVAHGFRSTFKTWCSQVDKMRDEVSEIALAHVDKNKVREAYLRADFVDERKKLMQRWEAFLNGAGAKRKKRSAASLQSEPPIAAI